MSNNLELLQFRTGYQFNDPSLAVRALTHRSASADHNERFEFLGDAVLGLIIAGILFDQFPQATEGELSRMRANLVNRDVLAEVATDLELGSYLQLGMGERKSGGKRRISILADALEALLAAVYLDSSLEDCRKVIQRLFEQRLSSLSLTDTQKDSKTRLQEHLQALGLDLPEYQVSDVTGEAHDQTFTVTCSIVILPDSVTGSGKSKRLAEQDAANQILDLLDKTT